MSIPRSLLDFFNFILNLFTKAVILTNFSKLLNFSMSTDFFNISTMHAHYNINGFFLYSNWLSSITYLSDFVQNFHGRLSHFCLNNQVGSLMSFRTSVFLKKTSAGLSTSRQWYQFRGDVSFWISFERFEFSRHPFYPKIKNFSIHS